MNNYTALFDANVLYPAPMRDLLLQLAITDLFKAKWTATIQEEWIAALLRNEPHRNRAALERTANLMNISTRDCLITDYEQIIPSLNLPDPNDCHVLAAAIVGRCDVIVTQNQKHFPEATLKSFGIEAQHPDEFLINLIHLAPGVFCSAVKKVRARLKSPVYSATEYLETLTKQGLVATSAELHQYKELI